ncbi:HD domain-containing protein [Candidatus Bathyarchaeota archaeon]|nr:HD domain-containing protein [Candidatus Bathyarchaeota archaeon]
MDREEALTLVKSHVHRTNLLKHMLAVEAIMREVANCLNEDAGLWGVLGLLHDLDFDETYDNPEFHGTRSAEMLTGKVDDELLRAIKAHSYVHTGVKPESKMEKALIAADAVSGMIIACALVMPGKKLSEVRLENVVKRLKEKDFARNCNREHMLFCEQIGLSWPKFAELALHALQGINRELDL